MNCCKPRGPGRIRSAHHRWVHPASHLSLAVVVWIVYAASVPAEAGAEGPDPAHSTSIYIENDTFAGTDRNYTNGIKLTWTAAPLADLCEDPRILRLLCPLVEHLPFVNRPNCLHAVSLAIGQNMYTPEDTLTEALIEDDRPYAGILYLALGFHGRDETRMDSLELVLGVVGPHAYAEEAQCLWHDVVKKERPRGWENQLEDEPVVEVFYERKYRVLGSKPSRIVAYDLIPHVGGGLGNLYIYANAGIEGRFGFKVPDNFGTCPIRPGCVTGSAFDEFDPRTPGARNFGIHLFVSLDGQVVARNLYLDGSTFRDSHSVDKKYFVADAMVGIELTIWRFKLSYAYIYRTREWDQQPANHLYGSLTAAVSF